MGTFVTIHFLNSNKRKHRVNKILITFKIGVLYNRMFYLCLNQNESFVVAFHNLCLTLTVICCTTRFNNEYEDRFAFIQTCWKHRMHWGTILRCFMQLSSSRRRSDGPFHSPPAFCIPKTKMGSCEESCQSSWFRNFLGYLVTLHYKVPSVLTLCVILEWIEIINNYSLLPSLWEDSLLKKLDPGTLT